MPFPPWDLKNMFKNIFLCTCNRWVIYHALHPVGSKQLLNEIYNIWKNHRRFLMTKELTPAAFSGKKQLELFVVCQKQKAPVTQFLWLRTEEIGNRFSIS